MSARALYTFLLRLALPFALLRLWWRGRRDAGYRAYVAERFGRYAAPAIQGIAPGAQGIARGAQGGIWVHAVSVGEARAAAPLVRALKQDNPELPLLLTCTTVAGRQTLAQIYDSATTAVYLPYDLPHAVRAFLDHFRPVAGILMETEIWPNLLAACRERGISVTLANARLSEKSARRYARWPALMRPAFESLEGVCAQSDADARRLAALGAANIAVTGSLKFDVDPDAGQQAAGRAFRAALGQRALLLFASTREGEEALLLDALPRRLAALVVIVPRHPLRFDEVARQLTSRGLRFARRSRGETPSPEHHVYLGDTLGEMAFFYSACDVAVIGGSFMPLGGQNLIEACAAGAPVVIGPSVYNFTDATRLALEAGAAVQVANAAEAVRTACELLDQVERRAKMGIAGRQLVAAHRGATRRHLAVLRRRIRR